MKRLFAVCIAAGLLGCQAKEEPEVVEVNLEDKEHKLSYAIGLDLSHQLKQQQGMAIDLDVFVQGFKDGYSGESSLLSWDEAVKFILEIGQEQRAQQMAEEKQNGSRKQKNWRGIPRGKQQKRRRGDIGQRLAIQSDQSR